MKADAGRNYPFVPGRNCWAVADCERLAFLIDGARYFEALLSAMSKARRRIVMVGWDFDARTVMRPDDADGSALSDCLLAYLKSNPQLEIYLLIWRNSIFYGSNPLPIGNEWWDHPRIHFKLDDHHPLAASHHQKIVCIDDKLAFVGGIDVTQGRWDTPTHIAEDSRRMDHVGKPYHPVHDVQALVSGEVACRMCAIASERWEALTNESMVHVSGEGDPWPDGIDPDIQRCRLAIARTQPGYAGQQEVREIEVLNLDLLRSAKRWIYIETQYFALPEVTDILVESLSREDGPEVVIVATHRPSGVVEQYVMAENRNRLFAQLKAGDKYGRLRTYYPVCSSDGECEIKVHSKLLIIDDDIVRIGSSNLNSRSIGLDTECDIALYAESDAERSTIHTLRIRLLAEHLGIEEQLFEDLFSKSQSLIGVMDTLNISGKLKPFPIDEELDEKSPTFGTSVLDPSQPISFKYVMGKLIE